MSRKKVSFLFIPVVLLCVLMLNVCSGSGRSDVPVIIWWQIGNNSVFLPQFSKQLSEYTEAKIGVRLEIRQGTWGNSSQRFNAMINTGEYFDIMFTDVNVFTHFSTLGAFADLSTLMDVVPELYHSMPKELWKGVSLDGKIFGIPTYKDSAATQFVFWDASITEKIDFDITDNSWENWDSIFRTMKVYVESPRFFPYNMSRNDAELVFTNYVEITAMLPVLGVQFDDPLARVVLTLEQPDVIERYRYLNRWFEDGIINSDANMTYSVPENHRPFFTSQAWPGVARAYSDNANRAGRNVLNKEIRYIPVQYFGPLFSTTSIQGSINSISINSRHKEEALKLLQLVNTDPVFRDMMSYGIEGEHFEYVYMEDGRRAVHRLNNLWPLINYQIGNYFILTPENTVPVGYWDEVRYLNETAFSSYLLGFTFDITRVEAEVINCRNTWERFNFDLKTGAANPDENLPVLIAELERKGIRRIIAEAQRQIDVFLNTDLKHISAD
ncbi:MAG: ABC transporter substrate-binding protein [Treponema sp.]|jgi:putative aldouronate transport system substrate-binding protein|nr:ABC transporter substrate-binding protein [Treponema sp.]